MEATITRPSYDITAPSVTDDNDQYRQNEANLPPPPTPFPVDLLNQPGTSTHPSIYHKLENIQRSCVHALARLIDNDQPSSSTSTPLSHSDAQLAGALTELLEVCYELESCKPSSSSSLTSSPPTALVTPSPDIIDEDSFEDLTTRVSDLQHVAAQRSNQSSSTTNGQQLHPAVNEVREELAWNRVESLTRDILSMVGSRRQTTQYHQVVEVDEPPSYTRHDQVHGMDTDQTSLPSYEDYHPSSSTTHLNSKNHHDLRSSHPTEVNHQNSSSQEKTLRDLDAVADAIEHLHDVSPRFHDQRSELRKSTQTKEQIQARMHRDKMRELEEIWDKIERTHGKRRMVGDGQRVDKEEIEAARAARRRRFFESLLTYGEFTRLEDQDSSMRNGNSARLRERKPLEASEGLRRPASHLKQGGLSLPSTPKDSDMEDPMELVTMADFFKERSGSFSAHASPTGTDLRQLEHRSRSNSLPSEDGDVKKSQGTFKKIAGMVRRGSLGLALKAPAIDIGSVTYVAEHQENLQSVQIMVHGVSISLKDDMHIETDKEAQQGLGASEATLVSKRDPSTSLRVLLPTPVITGQSKTLDVQDLHLETKLAALPTTSSAPINSLNTHLVHALSGSQLRDLRPKALCCTTCDREVANLSKCIKSEDKFEGSGFKDLPSEHWSEMMEVWMCHDDPGFTARLAKQTKDGFWPTRDNILVGGSSLLVHGEEVKRSGMFVESTNAESWEVVRCACGEILGKRRTENGKPGSGTVRFSKWAIALLRMDDDEAESVEPIRFPLSVFIMSDLLELAQAHASYRFIIKDEESDTDRVFLWLFNPSIGISYRSAPSAVAPPSPLKHSRSSVKSRRSSNASMMTSNLKSNLPKSIKAAKVFYKIMEPAGPSSHTNGNGNNLQVEHVSYPADVVQNLITILKESTAVYPAARRNLSGYEVGFLERL